MESTTRRQCSHSSSSYLSNCSAHHQTSKAESPHGGKALSREAENVILLLLHAVTVLLPEDDTTAILSPVMQKCQNALPSHGQRSPSLSERGRPQRQRDPTQRAAAIRQGASHPSQTTHTVSSGKLAPTPQNSISLLITRSLGWAPTFQHSGWKRPSETRNEVSNDKCQKTEAKRQKLLRGPSHVGGSEVLLRSTREGPTDSGALHVERHPHHLRRVRRHVLLGSGFPSRGTPRHQRQDTFMGAFCSTLHKPKVLSM